MNRLWRFSQTRICSRACRILALTAAALAVAAAGPAPEPPAAQVYADCLSRAAEDPEAAYEDAQAWQRTGGGTEARHCAAMALLMLGYYAEAATRLEVLAEELNQTDKALTVEALRQSGQAWLQAGEIRRTLAVQTTGLDLAPDHVELLIDRAIAWAYAGNYQEAIADLSRAREIAPDRAEIRVLRADANRKAGNTAEAWADIEKALASEPDNPEGLLVRGLLRREEGDADGARSDWLDVLLHAPEGPSGDAARRYLEALDVRVE